MLSRWLPTLLALAVLVVSGRAADDTRFSQTLNATERSSVGIGRLSSDQVAVLDALVRRDTAAQGSTVISPKTPHVFSQRLTDDERRNCGFAGMKPEEISRLDALVEHYESARLARTLLSPPAFLSASPRGRVSEDSPRADKNIHGEFSVSFGWGKGGYSERTGSMMIRYDDPQDRFSIGVGYTESHVKAPNGVLYRDYGPYVPGEPLRP